MNEEQSHFSIVLYCFQFLESYFKEIQLFSVS